MAAILQAIEQLEIITTGLATPAVEPRRDLVAVCKALHLAVTEAKTDGFRPGQEEIACRSVLRTHVAPDTRPGALTALPGREHVGQGRQTLLCRISTPAAAPLSCRPSPAAPAAGTLLQGGCGPLQGMCGFRQAGPCFG
jgi:hypothetical protein